MDAIAPHLRERTLRLQELFAVSMDADLRSWVSAAWPAALLGIVGAILALLAAAGRRRRRARLGDAALATKEGPAPFVPESVNYHLTRQCNYKCRFCFHTASTSHHEPLERAMHGLRLLAAAGMRKINFSGGEPFLIARGDYVGSLVRFCKEQLGVESVTIVTNGSRVRRDWFDKYGQYLDIMAVSCDSFEPPTLAALGRGTGQESYTQHLARIAELASWCADSGVKFKINSVITALNAEEDMRDAIRELAPVRWKVFQCLAIEGENSGTAALRDASSLMISAATFQRFVDRHGELACLVPECNDDMRNSYLILDEFMRFLDNTHGQKRPSRSILDVGVSAALCDSGFDAAAFERRGGRYDWSRPVGASESGPSSTVVSPEW